MGGRGTWAWINESADRFAAADQGTGNAEVFSSVELVDWMLGFSKGK
jgi:hypothetical protein